MTPTTSRTHELASAKRQLGRWKAMVEQLLAREALLTAQIDSLVKEMSSLEAELHKEQEFGFLSVQEAALSIAEKARLESALAEAWKELDFWRNLDSTRNLTRTQSKEPMGESQNFPRPSSAATTTTTTTTCHLAENTSDEGGDRDAHADEHNTLCKVVSDMGDMTDTTLFWDAVEASDDAELEVITPFTDDQFPQYTLYTASYEILRLWATLFLTCTILVLSAAMTLHLLAVSRSTQGLSCYQTLLSTWPSSTWFDGSSWLVPSACQTLLSIQPHADMFTTMYQEMKEFAIQLWSVS
ncbi:hypothetical protein DFQ27_001970 [Actinomortierella ambigua]|uniref:Transmembrane protein n=1 Tax=Actinomortierella ambigua TaxID=1343610 RepID=A0A9P6U7N7_9FUNG|nr:hypothetical protein DFQ27_001970 [Actinomortierella ambigua]